MLGCPVKDYRGETFYASHNGGAVTNHIETSRTQDSFRRNPAFIWYGPSMFSTDNVAIYAGGNIYTLGWGVDPSWSTDPDYTSLYTRKRGPLFDCPLVWLAYTGGVKYFETPHRTNWDCSQPGSHPDTPAWATMATYRWAGNVAFTDGSIEFHERPEGGWFDPTE